jgi:PKHD-type hydroxylase
MYPETLYFQQNRFLVLTEVLDAQACERLTSHMHTLHAQGRLIQDQQCPSSHSIYRDPQFEALLAPWARALGEHIGVELLPTYTYCRLYRTGEVLYRHTDRESCEFTGTINLGHDPGSLAWPIYLTGDAQDHDGRRVDLAVGDMLLFKGQELEHWRPAYVGKWQVQLFAHFVDAKGPHRDHVNDQHVHTPARVYMGQAAPTAPAPTEAVPTVASTKSPPRATATALSAPVLKLQAPGLEQNTPERAPIFDGVLLPSWQSTSPGPLILDHQHNGQWTFSPDECARILAQAQTQYPRQGLVGAGGQGVVDRNVRHVQLYPIALNENNRWIFEKIARAASLVNERHFHFELMGITHELQLLRYTSEGSPGHYDWHTDLGDGAFSTRKLSVSIPLTAADQYEGGALIINDNGRLHQASTTPGNMNFFPSYQLHQVQPVTQGERWALVAWIHGHRGFR